MGMHAGGARTQGQGRAKGARVGPPSGRAATSFGGGLRAAPAVNGGGGEGYRRNGGGAGDDSGGGGGLQHMASFDSVAEGEMDGGEIYSPMSSMMSESEV